MADTGPRMTVLVGNIKGGCGKTTIATNLAVGMARAGLSTAIADVDRQRSSVGWAESRPADQPPVGIADWSREIAEREPAVDRLVIDAPAAMRMKDFEQVARRADLIVVPLLPSRFDIAATRRFLERLADIKPVRKQRAEVVLVLNRVQARRRSPAGLDAFLAEAGQPVAARLRDSALYADAAERGLSLFDLKGARPAALKAEWQPLLARVGVAATPG